jgi:hypothetical protein
MPIESRGIESSQFLSVLSDLRDLRVLTHVRCLINYRVPSTLNKLFCRYASSWGVIEVLRYHIPSGKRLGT